jgi:hypothetical protein
MIIYGYKPVTKIDPQIFKVESVARLTVDVEMMTVMLLDFFPFRMSCAYLQSRDRLDVCFIPVRYLPSWLPGMQIKRIAEEGSKLRQEMAEYFLNFVLESRVSH